MDYGKMVKPALVAIVALMIVAPTVFILVSISGHAPPGIITKVNGNTPVNSNNSLNKTSSPLFGPILVINVTGYSSTDTSTIQVFGSYFNSTRTVQVLSATINGDGSYTYLLSANVMLNLSASYVDGGFGNGSQSSLQVYANYNSKNPGAPWFYNNIEFNPYSVHKVNMTVSGNLTYLDNFFKGTQVTPIVYSCVNFIPYRMHTNL